MASMAPRAAPAETPSVNGVASGLRSSACSTTPDAASAAPTSAAASTRGSRATKKICASTFSAHGTEVSKTAPQVDGRAAQRRRQDDGAPAAAGGEERQRRPQPAGQRHGHRAVRRTGTTVRCPVAGWTCTSASTP